jgi:glyoxylase-like metal-dependent hydrolase (beta-lactamase superfamily II)
VSDIHEALDRHGARLERVLVTHGHGDHASGAPALAAAHPAAVFAKYPSPALDRRGVDWQPLADGDVVPAGGESLTVLHTPGHSPDHLAFWHEQTRTAFSGDLVVAGSSVMIQASRGGRLLDYMRSLERLISLEPRVLLPAHGRRVDNPIALLNGYLEHRRMRERQVLEALASGQSSVQAIAESIYHGLSPDLLAAAHENVRAHLEKLKAEGRAFDEAGRWTV